MLWGSSTKPPWRAHPPSNFLVGADSYAIVWCYHRHHPWIQSKLLENHKGEGNENKSRERRERGEGGIDRMRSNNGKQMEKKRKDSTHKVKEAMLSILALHKECTWRMKTKSKWLVFYTWPFEGRLNPKIALRPFSPILFLLVAHSLDKWITNVWARTMLLA